MKLKRLLAVALSAIMVASLAACGKDNKGSEGNNGGDTNGVIEVTIPSFKTGENVGAKFFLPQVERFNTKYEGEYKLNIEEVPQAAYNDKLKQLAQQDQLPVLMHGGDEDWFKNVAIPQGLFYDLSDWLESKPDVKAVINDESLEYCTTEDGKLTFLPLFLVKPTGFFYNSELYSPDKKPSEMTMDEFIESIGDGKIAFQTADNGWTSALLLTALIANEAGGADILKDNVIDRLDDYSDPAIVKSVEKLQKLMQTNATGNSVGAAYADAANMFMSNNAIMIANGPWMSADFIDEGKWSNGFKGEYATGALFPGNVGLARAAAFGEFWVADSATDKEKELATTFLEFICTQEEVEAYALAEGGSNPKLTYSENFENKLKETKVLAEFSEATTEDTVLVPNVLDIMPASVAETEFGKLLPKLVDGSYTAEEFCEQLSAKAVEAKS